MDSSADLITTEKVNKRVLIKKKKKKVSTVIQLS